MSIKKKIKSFISNISNTKNKKKVSILVKPSVKIDDIKKKRWNRVKKALFYDSELSISVTKEISDDVDMNIELKGKLDNTDNSINVKFTKKW